MTTFSEYTIKELKQAKSQSLSTEALIERPVVYDKDSPDLADLLANDVVRPVGRPKQAKRKEMISIRLDPDTLKRLRAMGPGWQSVLSRKIAEMV
ncbi:hypothetical protein FACS189431_3780 [Alphaproteobacteria bacterium]|nr:hypothetical protein FACS189431_3780 [Alphaproteobacteria bacterium]